MIALALALAFAAPSIALAKTRPRREEANKLDLNTASEDELKALPGIGDAVREEDHRGQALQGQGRAGREEDRPPGDLREDQGQGHRAPGEVTGVFGELRRRGVLGALTAYGVAAARCSCSSPTSWCKISGCRGGRSAR